MTRIRLAVCCLLACAAARAEDPPMLTEHAFLDELPVVLSVTRLAQPISESPTAVTLVDREMIVASGARDIPEVLRLVPGMAVGFESGHNPVVTYHGLADQFPRRMQVLVDGRSIYTPDVASVRWSDLPLALEDIERIEVIRGPAAATYGANSFLGAISITTRHPAEVRGALLAVRRGSEGIEDGVLRYAASLGAVDLRGTFAYRSDAGFDQRFDDRRIRQATLRADYRAGLADSIELQLGASEVPRQDGFVGDDVQPIRTVTGRSHYEQLRWRHTLGEEQELSLQAYHRHQRHDDRLGGFALPVLDASLETDRYDLELQHTVGSGTAGWRLVWGAGGRLDQLRAPLYFARADTLENQLWHGFGNLEFRLGSLLVNAGAMLEQSDIAGRQLSPRLALSYHLTPQQTVRAGVSRAYHTPGLFDTLADLRVPLLPPPLPRVSLFRGGLDLEPESILS
jgi:iron complex outermembrane receptor protein